MESHAEGVRERNGTIRVVRTEDGERQAPDGPGNVAAVLDEVVNVFVRRSVDVHFAPVNDLAEALHRQRVPTGRVRHGGEHWVIGLGVDRVDVLAHQAETSELLFG